MESGRRFREGLRLWLYSLRGGASCGNVVPMELGLHRDALCVRPESYAAMAYMSFRIHVRARKVAERRQQERDLDFGTHV